MESSFTLLHLDIQFPLDHLLKKFLFPVFLVPLLNINCLCVCTLLFVISILIHWSACLFSFARVYHNSIECLEFI